MPKDHVEDVVNTYRYVSHIGPIPVTCHLLRLKVLNYIIAGFGYSFISHKLESGNYDEFSGLQADIEQPLVNQPGTRFEYGVGNAFCI